jgi:hypothetical protein
MGALHSASLIGASSALLFVVPLGAVKSSRQRLLTWCAIALVVMCAFVPWVINATYRHVGHPLPVSMLVASQTVGGWLIGYGDALPSWTAPAASVLVLAALALSITVLPQLGRLVFCYIVWPLAFGALLCIAVEPIWLERTFAFCAPFLGIAFGSAASRWLSRGGPQDPRVSTAWRASLIGVVVAALAVIDYRQATTPYKPDQFRDLAQYLARAAKPGEIICANEGVSLWGISRYLLGPDWGDILKVYDLADLERLKKWQRLESLLGRATLAKLGAVPTTRRLDGFRVPIFIGPSSLPDLRQTNAVWLVTDGTTPEDLTPCADPSRYPAPLAFGRLQLYHVACAHGG